MDTESIRRIFRMIFQDIGLLKKGGGPVTVPGHVTFDTIMPNGETPPRWHFNFCPRSWSCSSVSLCTTIWILNKKILIISIRFLIRNKIGIRKIITIKIHVSKTDGNDLGRRHVIYTRLADSRF